MQCTKCYADGVPNRRSATANTHGDLLYYLLKLCHNSLQNGELCVNEHHHAAGQVCLTGDADSLVLAS
jgi:hypothetical protein